MLASYYKKKQLELQITNLKYLIVDLKPPNTTFFRVFLRFNDPKEIKLKAWEGQRLFWNSMTQLHLYPLRA